MSTHALDIVKVRRIDPYADAVKVTESNMDAIVEWGRQNGQEMEIIDRIFSIHYSVANPLRSIHLENAYGEDFYAIEGDWIVYDEHGVFDLYGADELNDFYEHPGGYDVR